MSELRSPRTESSRKQQRPAFNTSRHRPRPWAAVSVHIGRLAAISGIRAYASLSDFFIELLLRFGHRQIMHSQFLSNDATWAGALLLIIGGLFFAAIVIGVIARTVMPERYEE